MILLIFFILLNGVGLKMSSKYVRSDSDSSATFSNSASTPNGSSLGSETDEDGNDDLLVKYEA